MEIRKLQVDDCAAMWRINEEGLPGVGKVTQASMEALLDFSILPLGMTVDATLAGFVLCLLPGTQYGSPNYRWFHERYDSFLYVDRMRDALTISVSLLLRRAGFDRRES